ncbi:Abhydrolase domain-containing protein 11, partial [Stegodyphus mimosarum]
MDTNSIPKASFIGHSMGGIAVMSLALKAPEKVEKIIVEDVSPKEPEPELYYVFQAMVAELIKCFEQSSKSDTEGTVHQKLRECIYRTVPMIPDEDREVIQSMKFPIKKTENGFVSLTNLTVLLKAVKNPPICHFSQNNAFSGNALFIYGGQSNFCILV